MKNWYDRGGKVHRPPQVTSRVQRLLQKPPPAPPRVDEVALRKHRRARLEARRAAARLAIERKVLLDD